GIPGKDVQAWAFISWSIEPAAWAAAFELRDATAELWSPAMCRYQAMNQSPKAAKSRILLVDDHPVVREGLAERINRESDLEVCAEAEDRREALQAIERTKPDLIMVDIVLKTSNGIDLIKDIHSRWPRLPMLVVSMHDEGLYAERALRAGA